LHSGAGAFPIALDGETCGSEAGRSAELSGELDTSAERSGLDTALGFCAVSVSSASGREGAVIAGGGCDGVTWSEGGRTDSSDDGTEGMGASSVDAGKVYDEYLYIWEDELVRAGVFPDRRSSSAKVRVPRLERTRLLVLTGDCLSPGPGLGWTGRGT